jgi:hypothetical protein
LWRLRHNTGDFVYVGADDIYLCTADERLSYRYTNEEDGNALRRYWTGRIDESDPRVGPGLGCPRQQYASAFLHNLLRAPASSARPAMSEKVPEAGPNRKSNAGGEPARATRFVDD